jgi:hypothetical protein
VRGVLGPWDNPQGEHPRTGITVSHGPRTAFASARFDPKRHEDVSHSKCFAKSSKTSFLLAFIRVFRGMNFGCSGAALGNPWLFSFEIISVHSCEFVVRHSDCNVLTIQRFNDAEGIKQNPFRIISNSLAPFNSSTV